jgi:ribosomal protein L7/L12
MPEVVHLLEAGNKIHAVDAYRDVTGAGLEEAEDAIEEIVRVRGSERWTDPPP